MTYHSPSHPSLECGVNILPKNEKSRRSPSAIASVGIRASALDFPDATSMKLLEEFTHQMQGYMKEQLMKLDEKIDRLKSKGILKERSSNSSRCEEFQKPKKEKSHYYRGSEAFDLHWKKLSEEAQMKGKERREKELKELERKEKEIAKDKEREEKEKQEKESKGILLSNGSSTTFVDLNLQELKEELPKETTFSGSQFLKGKAIDIIPSAPLYIQPTFISQVHVSNEETTNDCVVENTNANQKFFVEDLFMCEKKIYHGLFALKSYSLKQNWILSPLEADTCHKRRIHELSVGVCSNEKNASLMLMEWIKSEFLLVVFDPGG